GQHVPEGGHMIGDGPGPDVTGPAGQKRRADAPLVELALVAAEGPVAVENVGHALPLRALGTVVRGEEDNGVVIETALLQRGEDRAHLIVEAADHARE